MFKKLVLITLIVSSLYSQADVKSTLVGLQECAPLPAELKFIEKPNECRDPNSTILFMFSGEDVIGFEEGSLYFDTISVNGKDYSVDKFGEPTYNMANFPIISQSGKYAFLEVIVSGLPFGSINKVKAQGNLKLLIGSNLIENSKIEIQNIEKIDGLEFGPIKFLNPEQFSKSVNLGNSLSIYDSGVLYGHDAISGVLDGALDGVSGGALGGVSGGALDGVSGGELNLSIEGYDSSVVKFEVYENDRKLERSGVMSSNNIVRALTFSGYNGGPITINIDYWGDVKTQKVAINI